MFETPEEFQKRIGQLEIGVGFEFRSRGQVIRDFVIAGLLVAACVALAFLFVPSPWIACVALIVFAMYSRLAYFVRARPNHDYLGSTFAQSYSKSYRVNGALLFIALVFAFGRYVSVGLVDGVRLLARGQLPHERFMQSSERA